MKSQILLCSLLICHTILWAQPYAVTQLGVEKGLSNNNVVSIAQDKHGFLWFATEDGLNKFDGTRFITYYKNPIQQESGITGNELNCLLDDPKDSILWIGTQRAGLNAYDYVNDTFTYYQHDKSAEASIITNDITSIVAAADGNLWITTYWKGVEYFDKKSKLFTHYNSKTLPDLVSDNIWSVADPGDGNLYVGHVFHGLSIITIKDRKIKNFHHEPNNKNSLPGNEVKCIYKDSSNNIWIGTNKGLALFNHESENFIRFNTDSNLSHYIYDICQIDGNKLWIAMEFGAIAIMDLSQRLFLLPEQTRFNYIKEGDDRYSLSNSSVRCVFQDSFKNVWAGMWGGGINFLSYEPPLFHAYHYSPNKNSVSRINNKTVSSVCEDKLGKVWIGTDGGGINVFHKGVRTAIYQAETKDLSGNSVQSSIRDSKGNLWFGLFTAGVNYFDTKNNVFSKNFLQEIKNEDIRSIFEDKQHEIWIGTSNGIYKTDLSGEKITAHYNFENNLIRSVIKDSQERLWIGSFGSGLGVGDSNMENIQLFDVSNQFPSNTINTIYEDSKMNIWVGTGEGLICFGSLPSLEYRIYRRADGLKNTHIRAITEDNNGNIWVSTNEGISCLLRDKGIFYNYDHLDNVPMGNFISGCVFNNANGDVYFGSINGLCHFNPELVLTKRDAPPAVITEIKIFCPVSATASKEEIVEINGQHKIKLSYIQNSFNISFNIRNYALTNQIEYEYMLKGLDISWYKTNSPNNIAFRNVPPGSYQFLVKTRINNQEWSSQLTTLDIRITPPLWLTWWAQLIYLLIVGAILFFIMYAYKRKLKIEALYNLEKSNHKQEQELNNERLRFYTNITHELRTPLTLILGPIEDMLKDITLSAKQTQKISVIHQSAVRLLNLINRILEFRKTETQNKALCVSKDNLSNLIYETWFKYKELNRNINIEFRIEIEFKETIVYFDREIIIIILDNLIANAIKYTERGSITLSLNQTVKNDIAYTEIKVSDTGYGISAQALPRIFDRYYQENSPHQASGTGIGLALVKNLVQLHEGEIEIESTPSEGSDFCVRLLSDNNYPRALHSDSTYQSHTITNTTASAQSEVSSSNKPIILIVEDNKDIRDYICETLSSSFEIISATNGAQGQEQAIAYTPDIIVSDIMMPIMDGFALCQQLKEDVRTSHIPIILLTAKDSLENKADGYQAGADSYLTKPFSATLLQSRIDNLLESRKKLIAQFNSDLMLNKKRVTITESLNKLDNEFIEKVTLLVEGHLTSERVDIAYLSDKMCMSSSTLYRKMKALSGLSTNEFIRKIKMHNAERLLLEGKFTISEIAFKVGINSIVYFRQCFKEEFGDTPSDYIKKITQ